MHSSGRGKKPKNAWNTPSAQGREAGAPSRKSNSTATENKFKEAQIKLQAAVEKYAKDYESSSSEDELESDNVIGSLLKNYSQVGGKAEHLGRTQAFLEDALTSGAATCLICIGSIKRIEKIWSCVSCYCFFHLQCIERWSKDSVTQQKESQREHPPAPHVAAASIQWGCPKCRHEYGPEQIPREYRCFCGKQPEPAFQPWLVPHSCGEPCGRALVPPCGHACTLLCHPGPCPPCPKTVSAACHCGGRAPRVQRCSSKAWSCGGPCGRALACGLHTCPAPCHAGPCKPCARRSTQRCQCGAREQQRDCATPQWRCELVCGRPLTCGHHNCPETCHRGPCTTCILAGPRTCPCGKTSFQLPCTQDTPTCGDTCGKLLECGAHTCSQRCHKDQCGSCLELAVKSCRCGLHEKEVQCQKQYLCEVKCKKIRDCNKHPCNRKCCDGNCPPCEKPCGRTLPCGLHKCGSVCHRGPCYPCRLTDQVRCRCGATALTVPCGRRKRTRPPRCSRPCRVPPDCQHPQREPHRCHFGECPPCRQACGRARPSCPHPCTAACHGAVLVRVSPQQASMPWERAAAHLERQDLPCPPCQEPVPVTCLGQHETSTWRCHLARAASCHRPCGRALACGNHTCPRECHDSAELCEQCERGCEAPRPAGCPHECPRPCHTGPCPPCKHMLRLKCHCGLNQPYVHCAEWTHPESTKESLQSCGNQCPKTYACGHRCKSSCHSGLCPNPDLCKKKVKIHCPCKRIKKEFSCELVRNNSATVDCDQTCLQKKEEAKKQQEMEMEAKKKEEEARNARELEQFQKKFQGKKKYKDKKISQEVEEKTFLQKYWIFITAFLSVLLTVYLTI